MCSTLSFDFDSLIFSAQSAQSNYLQGSKYHALVELLNLEKLISKLKCDLLAGDVQDDPILTNLLEMILAQDQNLINFPDLSSFTPNNVDQTQSDTLELFPPNFTPDSQFLESAVYSPVIESPSTSTPKSAPEKRSNNSEFEVSDEDDGFQVPSLSNHTIESNKRLKTSSKKRQAKEKSPEFDPETIQRLDQLFLQFLCTVCSDLDAVDSQGEKLLVTYSDREITKSYETGYHIFKFRMKPFARSLQDHFHHSGITETVLPDRKFKEYLNQHKYISRFSDEGKKAKSKGAMVWIVKAKKNLVTGDWIFLECGGRRIGGEEPKKFVVAGEFYSYSPVVVDPNIQDPKVVFTSPFLPPWLAWEDNVLKGVSPNIEPEQEITVIANYSHGEANHTLSKSFKLTVLPNNPENRSDSTQSNFPITKPPPSSSSNKMLPMNNQQPYSSEPDILSQTIFNPKHNHKSSAVTIHQYPSVSLNQIWDPNDFEKQQNFREELDALLFAGSQEFEFGISEEI